MNIVINGVLSYEQPRGVGRYLNMILPALSEIDDLNQYYVFYGDWMKEYSFLKIEKDNFHFIPLKIKNSQLIRNLYLSLVLPIVCRKYHPDLFMLMDTQAILCKPCKMISVIHDLAEYEVPEKYSAKQAFLRRLIVRIQARLSDKLITDSEYSGNDIKRILKIPEQRVRVIPLGIDLSLFVRNTVDVAPGKYFLFVSEQERAKGPCALLEAFNMLSEQDKKEYSLIYVGKRGNESDHLEQLIKEYGLSDRVQMKGYVSDEELVELYEKAYAFVFPSLFEGFGFPVLEAMAKGTPVICSNRASIPEVGGDAVLTFDPVRTSELRDCMNRLIHEDGLRAEMREKGFEQASKFSIPRMAKETLNEIDNIVK